MKKIVIILIVISLFLIFLSFLFQINQVWGTNMEPTVKSGQTVILKRNLFSAPNPRRGDIVLYLPKNTEMPYLGRVIGLPSESVKIENGDLYLDDNNSKYQVKEEYLPPDAKTIAYESGEWVKMGAFEYFILGDKRPDNPISIKSSLVPRQNIKDVLFLKL